MGWKYLNAPLLWAKRIHSEFQYFSVSVGNLNTFQFQRLQYQQIFNFCTFPSGPQIERPRTRPPRAGRGLPCHCTLCPPPSPETWNICTTPILVASVLHQVHQANSPAPDSTCTCTATHLVTSPLGEAGGVPTTLVTPEQWLSLDFVSCEIQWLQRTLEALSWIICQLYE